MTHETQKNTCQAHQVITDLDIKGKQTSDLLLIFGYGRDYSVPANVLHYD